jgi:hypothetical protein
MDYLMLRRRIPAALRPLADRLQDSAEEAYTALTARPVPLPPSVEQRRVLVLGASVAKAWRLHRLFPNVRALQRYRFDKQPLVQQALAERPDAAVIKQCAVYFPGDEQRWGLVPGWARQLREGGVRPAVATVAPVNRAHASAHPGRAEGLWAYNDWLRGWAEEQQVPLLDLEAALRCGAADRHLDPRLASGDGLHLLYRSYREVLDSLIPPLLLRLFSEEQATPPRPPAAAGP